MSGQRRANKETGSLLPRSLSDYESSSSFACEDRSLRRDLSIESGKSPDISFVEAKKPLEKLAFYRHQVAGHYPIFWKKGEVCKSIQKNELEFYKHIQAKIPELVPFVPKYLGVVDMEHGNFHPHPQTQIVGNSNFHRRQIQPNSITSILGACAAIKRKNKPLKDVLSSNIYDWRI